METKQFSQQYEEGYFDENGYWVECGVVTIEFDLAVARPTYENMGEFSSLSSLPAE